MDKKAPAINPMQLFQLVQAASMENDQRVQRAMRLLQLDPGLASSELMAGIAKELSEKMISNAMLGKTPYPYRFQLEEDVTGPLRLGQVVLDIQSGTKGPTFGMYPIELSMHALIAGGTGTGKTNFGIFGLASEIHRFNTIHNLQGDERIGCWFIQTSKTDENYVSNINPDTLFFHSGNLKINPLYHEGHNKQEVFQKINKLLGEVTFYREGTANQVALVLQQLDEKFQGNPFSLFELLEGIRKLPRSRYEGVFENRLSGILTHNTKKIFDCIRGIPLENLAHEFAIFNLTDLDFYSQELISIFLFLCLTDHYRNFNIKKLNTVLFYDEGDHIFSKHAEQALIGYPTASSLFTTSRASGIGVVVITHQPHLVLTSLRSEAYTRIIFNLSDAEDARYMAQACSLNKEEQEMISKLPNYYAIVRMRRCSRPFVIKAFNHADSLRQQPIQNHEQAERIIRELTSQVIPRQETVQTVKNIEAEAKPEPSLFDADSAKLLESIHRNPFLSAVERYKSIGLSASKGNKVVKLLEEKNLLRKVPVKIRRGKGNLSTFLELTKEGLEKLGKKHQPFKGQGCGIKHAFYSKKAAEHYEKEGHETRQEYKGCDVAVQTPEGLIAVEVCVHVENIDHNVQRNSGNGFLKTILVFEAREQLEKARAKILPAPDLEMKLIDEFLE